MRPAIARGPSRLWRRVGPSLRSARDPLEDTELFSGRFQPIAVHCMKMTRPVRRRVDAVRRQNARPLQTSSGHRLGVVIPLRNRAEHLAVIVPHLQSFLRERSIDFRIWVVEQSEFGIFNKGTVLNAGTRAALEWADYIAFHDVDFLPIEACYERPSEPLRPIGFCAPGAGRQEYPEVFMGGVVLMDRSHVETINGFSNSYWHWGREDDDLCFRCVSTGLVPFADRQGEFRELEHPPTRELRPDGTPAITREDRLGIHRLMRSNRRHFHSLTRGLADPTAEGLSTAAFRVLEEEDGPDYHYTRIQLMEQP